MEPWGRECSPTLINKSIYEKSLKCNLVSAENSVCHVVLRKIVGRMNIYKILFEWCLKTCFILNRLSQYILSVAQLTANVAIVAQMDKIHIHGFAAFNLLWSMCCFVDANLFQQSNEKWYPVYVWLSFNFNTCFNIYLSLMNSMNTLIPSHSYEIMYLFVAKFHSI